MFRWIDVLVPVEFPSSENLIPVRWIALPTHGLFLAKIDHAALWWHGGYSKFVFLGQGKWMNVMINQGIWVFWGQFSMIFRQSHVADALPHSGISGEQEQIRTVEGKEEVFLQKRMGFIKLALEQNAAVVPCYAFGCVDLYSTYTNLFFKPREWLRKSLNWSGLGFMNGGCICQMVIGTLNTTRWLYGKNFTDTTSEKLRNRQKCIEPIYVITISSSVHVHLSRVVSLVFLQLVVSRIVSLSENELKFFSQRYMCCCFAETGQKPPIRTITDHTPIVSNYDLIIIQPYRYIPIHNTYSHNPRKWGFSPHHNITQSHSVTVPLSWRIFRGQPQTFAMTMVSNHQWLSTVKAGRFSKLPSGITTHHLHPFTESWCNEIDHRISPHKQVAWFLGTRQLVRYI